MFTCLCTCSKNHGPESISRPKEDSEQNTVLLWHISSKTSQIERAEFWTSSLGYYLPKRRSDCLKSASSSFHVTKMSLVYWNPCQTMLKCVILSCLRRINTWRGVKHSFQGDVEHKEVLDCPKTTIARNRPGTRPVLDRIQTMQVRVVCYLSQLYIEYTALYTTSPTPRTK